MTLYRDLSIIYSALFTLVLFMSLFESRYPPKKTMALMLSGTAVIVGVSYVLLFRLGVQVMSTLILLTCSLPSMVFFWFISKQRDGRFFFTFCLADTMILWLMYVTSLLDFFMGNSYIVMAVSRLILCPLLAFGVNKWVRPGYREVQNKITRGWGVFAAIALIFYLLLTMSFSVPTLITQRLNQLPAFGLLLVLMPVLYLYIFRTLHYQLRAHEAAEKESILELQVVNMKTRIEEYSSAAQKSREEHHNFRHTLQTIAALAQNGQYDDLQNLIHEYCQNIPDTRIRRYCGHPVLDAVLASYLQQAERQGVRISTRLSFPEPLPVSETELATVFANAIENAINACEGVKRNKRYIDVQVLSVPCFMLKIRNSCDGNTVLDENGIPVSIRQGHGFGTRSIVTFCEKNSAFYEFKSDKESFEVCIVFR